MPPLSILIVGAGVAGPTLASFLLLAPGFADEKPHITILERSPALREAGQNIDVRGVGVEIVQKLGLESAIRSHVTKEKGMRFVSSDDRVVAEFPADDTGKTRTVTSDIEILRGRLGQLLFHQLKHINEQEKIEGNAGVEYLFGDYLDKLEQDEAKVYVKFARSGEERSFDIVVGADGLQSRTRRMAFGEAQDGDNLRQFGLYAAFFSMPRAVTDSDWCRWHRQPGRRNIMIRPGEDRDQSTALMMLMPKDDAKFRDVIASRDVDAQRALFVENYQDRGWECDRLVREMDRAEDFYCDMVAQVKMKSWSKGRVVLVGDAGYCGSPISGMGTTFGLTGAYHLAGALSRHRTDHVAAFQEYERILRPFVERGQSLPPGVPALSFPETAWGLWVFHAIMWFITNSGLGILFQTLVGPPADDFCLEEYGFKQVDELLNRDKNPA